ncbi:hypothetical protein [Streptomyces silvensis]|uniref:Uncharacterized protein n=1 Tax=Streptomyces silvensis TaxID=1765722 RepID=A0A0W7X7W2_9ACTN|nr:hypothetical protein [Streptomyces silvensis]KUF18823.1 hypothetical protein AT728_07245 [Streptomyces silvensis]
MQFEEHYIVEHVSADGRVDVEQYSDAVAAHREYHALARSLAKGEKVKLHRYTTVVLASAVRAK